MSSPGDSIAPAPGAEAERLAALASYGVLDTGRERRFDELAAVASHLCGTPIALVSLVDERELFFKAATGLALTEAPRAGSFCEQAIAQHALFEVPDVDFPLDVSGGAQRFQSRRLTLRAIELSLTGDLGGAADVVGSMGAVSAEAYLRLFAGEALLRDGRRAESERELERALAFHRSVGASAYVERAESLLAEGARSESA